MRRTRTDERNQGFGALRERQSLSAQQGGKAAQELTLFFSQVTPLSNLLPAESLIRPSKPASPSFELAAPNPILGKTVFLRLPIAAGWTYEVDDCRLRVERNLILRDQMWVTRGEARLAAVHESGVRVEVGIRVRPWKTPAHSGSTRDGPSDQDSGKRPDERQRSRSLLGRLGPKRRSARQLTIRCHTTERQIEIRWEGEAGDLERLLDDAHCHPMSA